MSILSNTEMHKHLKAINIQWDFDIEEEEDEELLLPSEISLPDGMTDIDEISDYISDFTGFCHKGFEISEV